MVKTHWLSNLPKELLEAEGYLNEPTSLLGAQHSSLVGLRQRLTALDSLEPEAPIAAWRARAQVIWRGIVELCKHPMNASHALSHPLSGVR